MNCIYCTSTNVKEYELRSAKKMYCQDCGETFKNQKVQFGPGRKTMLTQEQLDSIPTMYKNGTCVSTIAKKLHVQLSTIKKLLGNLYVPTTVKGQAERKMLIKKQTLVKALDRFSVGDIVEVKSNKTKFDFKKAVVTGKYSNYILLQDLQRKYIRHSISDQELVYVHLRKVG